MQKQKKNKLIYYKLCIVLLLPHWLIILYSVKYIKTMMINCISHYNECVLTNNQYYIKNYYQMSNNGRRKKIYNECFKTIIIIITILICMFNIADSTMLYKIIENIYYS